MFARVNPAPVDFVFQFHDCLVS